MRIGPCPLILCYGISQRETSEKEVFSIQSGDLLNRSQTNMKQSSYFTGVEVPLEYFDHALGIGIDKPQEIEVLERSLI